MDWLDFLAFGDTVPAPGLFDKIGPIPSGIVAIGSLIAWGAWMFVQQHLLSKRAISVRAEKAEIVEFFKARDAERAREYAERLKEFEQREDERFQEFTARDQERLAIIKECEDDRRKLRSQVLILSRRVGEIERRARKHRGNHDAKPEPEPDDHA